MRGRAEAGAQAPSPNQGAHSHCPGPSQYPGLPACLLACLLEPELTLLFLQICFLKLLLENSVPCQEPQALGIVKSNLIEHGRSTVYREAREMGQTRAQGKAQTGRT